MLRPQLEVELATPRMARRLIQVNDAALKVDVDKGIVGRIGRPFKQSGLRPIHDYGKNRLVGGDKARNDN